MPLWDRGAVLDSQSRSLNSGIALCALIVRTQIGSSVQDPPEWGWGGGHHLPVLEGRGPGHSGPRTIL
jgi:hypothetical protein